jgi:hypothetical protein
MTNNARLTGTVPLSKFRFDKKGWELERAHTRATILSNPDMLRDLECDSTDRDANGTHISRANSSDWDDLKKLYDLPELPTYHEWVFAKRKGVKVYYAGYKGADSWMTWHPEPRYRSNGHGHDCFSIGGLPNAEKHRATYITKSAKSLQRTMERAFPDNDELKYWRERQIRDGISEPDNLDYWRERISHYDTEKAIAKAVALEAIDLGFIRQDGVFDQNGKPAFYR